MTLEKIFLDFSVRKLGLLSSRLTDCLGRLSHEQVWSRGGESENAVGNLVLHLCGNVRQWIISGIGGAEDVRDRAAEFAAKGGVSVNELRGLLAATVADACRVIEGVSKERLGQRLTIQGYDVTVLEAIYSVIEHFAQHTGQVIYGTKAMTGSDLGYYSHLSKRAHGEKTP
ncbi:MAG: DinB family protein [Acidobacteriota bacterium]